MYVPKHFEQTEVEAIQALITANPLGSLVAVGPSGLGANHIPFELVAEPNPYGALFGHIARANPLWREVSEGSEALVIFLGANAYISPSWYPSKKSHGKVVPTWNYVVAHAHGRIRFIDDVDWVSAHIERLTNREESGFAQPWSVRDAPSDFTEKMLGAVIGIEIAITSLDGRWKVSQNRSNPDRSGVAEALRKQGAAGAHEMAAYIEDAKS